MNERIIFYRFINYLMLLFSVYLEDLWSGDDVLVLSILVTMGHSTFVCTFYFSIVLLAVFILRTRGPGRVRGSVSNLSPVRWGWIAANTVSLHRGKTGGVSDLSIYYLDHWLFSYILQFVNT